MTEIAGIVIPSDSPLFLGILAVHVPLGLACVITGLVAMFSRKGRGRHADYGSIYFWCLLAAVATATALAAMRWSEDYPLFVLGALSLGCAWAGRRAAQRGGRAWVTLHILGMGSSYTLMLIAFYVDNGPQLPGWRSLPPA